MKDKKVTSIVNAFKKIISMELHSKPKPNKIWIDQGSEFYNKSFKDFLKINNIEMYSAYNEGKSVVAEGFIKTFKNKILKHMAAISKNIYFDVLDDIVNKYNNTVHKTIKMKPIDVTDDYYVEYNKNPIELHSNKKILNLQLVTILEFQKIKTFLLKDILQIGQKKFLLLTKLKLQFYAISDLNGEEITGSFYEKEFQKTSHKEFRIEKVLKRKGDKLYVKWKGYNNSFNSWINKKDLI